MATPRRKENKEGDAVATMGESKEQIGGDLRLEPFGRGGCVTLFGSGG